MWQKNKHKIIAGLLGLVLVCGILSGCGSDLVDEGAADNPTVGQAGQQNQNDTVKADLKDELNQAANSEKTPNDEKTSSNTAANTSGTTAKDKSQNSATKEEPKPNPGNTGNTAKEPDTAKESEAQNYSCTISISCATALANIEDCDAATAAILPKDGWILSSRTVSFYEGESVFNVLQRTCKQAGIHLEFTNTPLYNSAYIEGINNLYEFDLGELSGWMYSVNGWFPNYGSSSYKLQDGDVIKWVYTCDKGVDVGGSYAAGKQ
jgi:hypothetical protein